MDGTEEEYEIKKAALEHKIQTLQNQAEAQLAGDCRGGNLHADFQQTPNGPDTFVNYDFASLPFVGNQQRPQSSNANLQRPTGFAAYSRDTQNGFGGHFASDSVLADQGSNTVTPTMNSSFRDTSGFILDVPEPASDIQNVLASTSSPGSAFVIPQKRQRSSLLHTDDSTGHANKSVRTTPSPALTGNTSPNSYESFDIPEDMFDFLGGDPKEALREMREEQRLQEKIAEEKRERLRLDEEYAIRLSEDLNDFDGPAFQQALGSSTLGQHGSQTILGIDGRYRRPTPFPQPSFEPHSGSSQSSHNPSSRYGPTAPLSSPPFTPGPDPFATPATGVKQEHSSLTMPTTQYEPYRSANSKNNSRKPSSTTYQALKQECSQQRRPSNHEFITLSDDSDSDSNPSTPGFNQNSDLIEIDPATWHNSSDFGHTTRFQGNGYDPSGNNSDYANSSIWNASGTQLGRSLTVAARGLYSRTQNLLGFDGNSVYGNESAISMNGAPYIDLSDDFSPSGWADNAFSLHGINANDPANRQMYASYMDRVDYVTHDPTRTAAEIKSLLENIRPDEDLPPENREGTPDAMTYPLMEHQKLGLAWLKKMEESEQKGGSKLRLSKLGLTSY